jgi:hypothetical protein
MDGRFLIVAQAGVNAGGLHAGYNDPVQREPSTPYTAAGGNRETEPAELGRQPTSPG